MCIGDWRLGQFVRSAITGATVTTGNTLAVPQNQQRVGLYFALEGATGPPAARCQLTQAGVLFGEINTNFPSLMLSLVSHGDLPFKAWTMTAQGATFNLSFIELFMPDEYLAAGLDDWRRQMADNAKWKGGY